MACNHAMHYTCRRTTERRTWIILRGTHWGSPLLLNMERLGGWGTAGDETVTLSSNLQNSGALSGPSEED